MLGVGAESFMETFPKRWGAKRSTSLHRFARLGRLSESCTNYWFLGLLTRAPGLPGSLPRQSADVSGASEILPATPGTDNEPNQTKPMSWCNRKGQACLDTQHRRCRTQHYSSCFGSGWLGIRAQVVEEDGEDNAIERSKFWPDQIWDPQKPLVFRGEQGTVLVTSD